MTIGFKANNDGSGAIQVNGDDILTVTPNKRITGDFSNAAVANRVMFQTSTVDGYTALNAIPNGTGTASYLQLFNSSDPNNAAIAQVQATSGGISFQANKTGTGTYLPMTFHTGGSASMQIATDGQQSSVIPGGSTLYPEYKCRAWVNFNGTGTVAIRASGNVSSITDNGTGDYTVNFTNAMPDANYSIVGMNNLLLSNSNVIANRTTTSYRINSRNSSFTLADYDDINVAVFR